MNICVVFVCSLGLCSWNARHLCGFNRSVNPPLPFASCAHLRFCGRAVPSGIVQWSG
jgi:hypothetical protein